ncbi:MULTISPECIES: hypothetical protein [Paraclostridium]|uniref:hypothetical protein n=1 Tax=Paraclostridium TaxID=1849822 RepID=UPI0021DF9D37|nr:hypothetical protein [Paraclostridium sp. AKS73]MCU9816664.1 hypothetical protein [Paraclostridium sp. AKS73]
MKKFKLITISLIIMVGIIFIVGCSSKSKIESAIDDYNKSWQSQDFEKCILCFQKNLKKI